MCFFFINLSVNRQASKRSSMEDRSIISGLGLCGAFHGLTVSASSERLIFFKKTEQRGERGLIIDLWTTLSVKLPTRNLRLNQACCFLPAQAGITDLVSSCSNGSPLGYGTCVYFGWKQSRLLKDTWEDTHFFFFFCQPPLCMLLQSACSCDPFVKV